MKDHSNQSQNAKTEMESPKTIPSQQRSQIVISLSPKKIAFFLCGVVFTIVVLGSMARFISLSFPADSYGGIHEIANRFDLDHENNIPAWYSSTSLLAAAALLAVIAWGEICRHSTFRWHWAALSAIFCYLAVDEAAYLHEILIVPLRRRLDLHGVFYFAWVIPGIFCVASFAVVYLKFLFHLRAPIRFLFIIAGGTFAGGALGMELVGGAFADWYGLESFYYSAAMTIEELLEMLGIVLFIYALLTYLGNHFGDWKISLFSEVAAEKIYRDDANTVSSLHTPSRIFRVSLRQPT